MRPWGRPALCALLLGLVAASPALAMYKVVGPDGSVTYTDRPPTSTGARVTTLGPRGEAGVTSAAATPSANLPTELRAVAARFPVTLYAAADCAPCESARQFLVQRGVPFAEKRIASEEDALELERLLGARTVPSLTIGAQALRGYANLEWASFLDVAGYPRDARAALPTPTATPLSARAAARNPAAGPGNNAGTRAPSPTPAANQAPPATAAPAPAAPSQEGIRF